MENYNIDQIPAEKFRFAQKSDLYHDSKFETKPVTYFQGAFRRFSKNKGAVVGGIVISILILFAIIAPFFTPFTPAYYDMVYAYVTPKNNLFVNAGIDFWDGCRVKDTNRIGYLKDMALASETGREIIKDGAISDANLRLLVDNIVISEQDGKLSINIDLKAAFSSHLDLYDEDGALTAKAFAAN